MKSFEFFVNLCTEWKVDIYLAHSRMTGEPSTFFTLANCKDEIYMYCHTQSTWFHLSIMWAVFSEQLHIWKKEIDLAKETQRDFLCRIGLSTIPDRYTSLHKMNLNKKTSVSSLDLITNYSCPGYLHIILLRGILLLWWGILSIEVITCGIVIPTETMISVSQRKASGGQQNSIPQN